MKKRHHSSARKMIHMMDEAESMGRKYERHVDEGGRNGRHYESMHDAALAEPSGPMKYAHAGMDPRRYEAADSKVLIKEDHNAPANLPQNYEIKYWPREGRYTPEVLNDGPDGIDKQIDMDDSMKMKLFKPRKY